MQKYAEWSVILVSLTGLLYFQGCANTPPGVSADLGNTAGNPATVAEIAAITERRVSYAKKILSNYSTVKVVRHRTAGVAKITAADLVIGSLAGAGVGLGGSMGYRVTRTLPAGEKLVKKYGLPDYGELLLGRFVAKASTELQGWPEMIGEDNPVTDDYTDTAPFIEFHLYEPIFKTFGIFSSAGLEATAVIKINNPDGSTIFRGIARYMSKYYGRDRKWDEFEADNGRLLREELEFAADTVAGQIVELFKGAK